MTSSSSQDPGHLYQYCNCKILRDGKIIREDLWVRDGKIMDPEKLFYVEQVKANEQIDCHGLIIAPGFIDVQINGGFSYNFSKPGIDLVKGVETVAKGILAHGVTSFCPTLVTSQPDTYKQILTQIKKCNGSKKGAGILGVHIEGPFINKAKKGAHAEELILEFEHGFQEVLDVYGDLENVNLVTVAPEKKNSKEIIEEFCRRGIVVSIGHSMASLIEGEEAVRSGARFITHLFNAMLPFHHRDPHLVGLLASMKLPPNHKVFYGLISDGVHTHPAALRIAHRVHPDGLVLVTDAISALGFPPGVYSFGEDTLEIKGNRAVLHGTETLCGSIASLDDCVRHFLKQTKCDVELALEVASKHPAQMLGIEHQKGTLDFGTDADFIILDDDLHVKATYIAGELVYSADN